MTLTHDTGAAMYSSVAVEWIHSQNSYKFFQKLLQVKFVYTSASRLSM